MAFRAVYYACFLLHHILHFPKRPNLLLFVGQKVRYAVCLRKALQSNLERVRASLNAALGGRATSEARLRPVREMVVPWAVLLREDKALTLVSWLSAGRLVHQSRSRLCVPLPS